MLDDPRIRLPSLMLLVLALNACSPEVEEVGAATQIGENGSSTAASVLSAVLEDITPVEEKFLSLAQDFSDQVYAWRPAEGVRSTAEVLMHVAATNYFFPMSAGVDPPAATGIEASDVQRTLPAFETKFSSKDSVLAELRASFQHLRAAIESTRGRSLEEDVQVFGEPFTLGGLWIGQAGHLHEHLGQLIAYARVNGTTPSWSQ